MERFQRLDPATGQSVEVQVFGLLASQYGGEFRLVRLVLGDGRRYHCHFKTKDRASQWLWPGLGAVDDLSTASIMAAVDRVLAQGPLEGTFTPTQSPRETWQWIVESYKRYPDYPWWEPVRRFLPIATRIAASPFGETLYASKSHETLIVSTVGTEPEREKVPSPCK